VSDVSVDCNEDNVHVALHWCLYCTMCPGRVEIGDSYSRTMLRDEDNPKINASNSFTLNLQPFINDFLAYLFTYYVADLNRTSDFLSQLRYLNQLCQSFTT